MIKNLNNNEIGEVSGGFKFTSGEVVLFSIGTCFSCSGIAFSIGGAISFVYYRSNKVSPEVNLELAVENYRIFMHYTKVFLLAGGLSLAVGAALTATSICLANGHKSN